MRGNMLKYIYKFTSSDNCIRIPSSFPSSQNSINKVILLTYAIFDVGANPSKYTFIAAELTASMFDMYDDLYSSDYLNFRASVKWHFYMQTEKL